MLCSLSFRPFVDCLESVEIFGCQLDTRRICSNFDLVNLFTNVLASSLFDGCRLQRRAELRGHPVYLCLGCFNFLLYHFLSFYYG